MDFEARAKIDVLHHRIATDEIHRGEMGRKLYEAEEKIKDLQAELVDLKKDVSHLPSRTELYATFIAVIAAVFAMLAIK